jgi:predicted RNA-binding Zn-ribbon protein involved in translation (DUF1610 family)
LGDNETHFHAEWDKGPKAMAKKAQSVLDEADYVIGWNSRRFDIPHLRTEMIIHELLPPSPHKDIDLLVQSKKHFSFMSNRMAEVAKVLDRKGKLATGGGDLWRRLRTAKGEDLWDARKLMAEYNIRDVELTEELYNLMLPWCSGLNVGAYREGLGPFCPNCASENIQFRGVAVTSTRTYRRYQCQDCGKWGREAKSVSSTDGVSL